MRSLSGPSSNFLLLTVTVDNSSFSWKPPSFSPNVSRKDHPSKFHAGFRETFRFRDWTWGRPSAHSHRSQTPGHALVFCENEGDLILFSRDDGPITHLHRTVAITCHRSVPGKLRVSHLFQELARPNANKHTHSSNLHFCNGLCIITVISPEARLYGQF